MPHLVYTDRSGQTHTYALRKKKIVTIGRARENDFVIDEAGVASSHAHLLCDSKGYTISAMDPRAPLRVNGKVKHSARLRPDDQVALGPVVLHFRMDDAPPPKPAHPSANELFQHLLEFSTAIMTNISSEDLFRIVLDHLIAATGSDKGFLLRNVNGVLQVAAARNVDRKDLSRTVEQVSDSIIERVVKTGKPIIVSDALNDDRFRDAKSVVDLKLSSVMCVPLKFRDELLGVLYLGNDRVANLFRQEDLDTLIIYAGQTALLLHSAQLLNELIVDNRSLREELQRVSFGRIVGNSNAMRAISKKIDRIASTDISILIQGETGTGKELIAREIHARSDRHGKPFISINCGAIPENLLESELFGHVRGAFTGALSNRIGKFEAANGGTIFLDEIGEMPMPLQVKLLRVLEERTIEKVGDNHPIPLDFRVISATNIDLEQAVKERRFREDLYYRLEGIRIQVPPLRERGNDIVLLAKYLLDKYAGQYRRTKVKGFTKDALTAMLRYYWPGNVREMENRIKRAVIMAERPLITPEDLEIRVDPSTRPIRRLADAQAEFTLNYIKEVLEINNWNKAKTARDLGVDPRTIFRYLEKIHG